MEADLILRRMTQNASVAPRGPVAPIVLRTPDAAQYINMGIGWLEKSRLRGDGPPFVRIGARAVGYLIADLDRWLASRRRASTSK